MANIRAPARRAQAPACLIIDAAALRTQATSSRPSRRLRDKAPIDTPESFPYADGCYMSCQERRHGEQRRFLANATTAIGAACPQPAYP